MFTSHANKQFNSHINLSHILYFFANFLSVFYNCLDA